MMTLAELIATNKGEDSYESLAARGGMSVSVLYKFSRGQNATFPPPETIFALARALRTSPRVVTAAAAQGLGIEMDEGHSDLLPPEADRLPADCKRALIDTARAMLAALKLQGHDPSLDQAAQAHRFAEQTRERVDEAAADLGYRTNG